MDSKETVQMMITTMMNTHSTVNALNERSKSYYELLSAQENAIKENKSQIKENGSRIEKLEIAISNLDILKEHKSKIETIEIDIANLKRDRWWIGIITGAVTGLLSSILVAFVTILFHIWL